MDEEYTHETIELFQMKRKRAKREGEAAAGADDPDQLSQVLEKDCAL